MAQTANRIDARIDYIQPTRHSLILRIPRGKDGKDGKRGPATWYDTKQTGFEPQVGAWHTDLDGATLDNPPVVGDLVIGASGQLGKITEGQGRYKQRFISSLPKIWFGSAPK